MKHFFLLLFLASYLGANAQHDLPVRVIDAQTEQPIPGATLNLVGTSMGIATDSIGRAVFRQVPAGVVTLRASAVGYETHRQTINVPVTDTIRIRLTTSEEELEEVYVTTTRSGRTVADEPTRVEVIDGEELDEKANMQPANISVILRESTGIQVQQTSVTSANVTFRIQGLDGRYTQLLQDGFPLFSGFSGGLSLLQTPPLNLRQVEILKGSQTTLYGSGAIAGLVNLVTKTPTDERDLSFLLNGTSAGGLDLNVYFGERFKAGKWGQLGATLYLTHNRQRPFDPNRDGFTDLPQTVRTTVQPKLFWYPNDRTTVSGGLIWSDETRTGGYIPTIEQRVQGYTEANDSRRWATQFRLDHRLNDNASLTAKNSVSQFRRTIDLNGDPRDQYSFDGLQRSTFTELSYLDHRTNDAGKTADWVVGLNAWTDDFSDRSPTIPSSIYTESFNRSYTQTIMGVFGQYTRPLADQLTLETGLRVEGVWSKAAGQTDAAVLHPFVLPRLSLLIRLSDAWTSRIGGGLGYKAPNVFTEEAERISFRRVRQVSFGERPEQSAGLNWDINYRTELTDDLTLSVNQLFFLTRLNRPLVLVGQAGQQSDTYQPRNANGYLNTRGFETNARLVFHDMHMFAGYSFIDAQRHYDNLNSVLPLTAKHRFYGTILYETERIKTGFEAFYVGQQQRSDGSPTRSYWTMGYMAEWKWTLGKSGVGGSVFINFENFLDARQSRYEPLVIGLVTMPTFVTDIYAPTDGRVINGGIKLHL